MERLMEQHLIFRVNNQPFALPLFFVERVARVVTIRTIAQNRPHICGVIDFQGKVISVVNLRSIFGYPHKDIELSDILLICRLDNTLFTLLVDKVDNTEFCEDQKSENTPTIPLPETLEKFIKFHDQPVPVYNLQKIFSHAGIQLGNIEAQSGAQTS